MGPHEPTPTPRLEDIRLEHLKQAYPPEFVSAVLAVWSRIAVSLADVAEAIRCVCGTIDQIWPYLRDIEAEHLRRAIKWAEVNRPKWVAIMRRTKKHRIRKKYADRILRAYEEETA